MTDTGVDEFLALASKTEKRKKAPRKEKTLENDFCDYAKKSGCLPLKLILLRLRGWPDRTVLCPNGRIVFFELKRTKNNKRSPNQNKWRNILINFGFTYHTNHDIEDAKQNLDDFLEGL